MDIGVIGSGQVGQTLAAGLAAKGHNVMLGTRDVKASLANAKPGPMGQQPLSTWAKANPKVKVGSMADAAKHGKALFFCVHGKAALDAVKAAGADNMAGKLVVDTTNPIDFTPNGVHWPDSLRPSILQIVQKAAPKANVVKALNCTPGSQMVDPKFKEGLGDQVICGNDAAAKEQAKNLLKELGWNSVDAGDASVAPYVEGMGLAVINYGAKSNDWSWGVKLVRRA